MERWKRSKMGSGLRISRMVPLLYSFMKITTSNLSVCCFGKKRKAVILFFSSGKLLHLLPAQHSFLLYF
jgi:site-specific recombinase XerC